MAAQNVTIECGTCHEVWTCPLELIPEDALVTDVARAFLDEHTHAAASFQVRVAPQEGTGSP